MKLNYGQLSMMIYNIVYYEAVDDGLVMGSVGELLDYLDENEDRCINILGDQSDEER